MKFFNENFRIRLKNMIISNEAYIILEGICN